MGIMDPEDFFSPAERTLCDLIAGRQSISGVEIEHWPSLFRTAREHSLAPYLQWLANEAGFTIPNPAIKAALLKAYFNAAARDVMFQRTRAHIDDLLSKAQIKPIWLKGASLGVTLYPTPLVRVMADLDFIIPADRRELALALLLENGYESGESDHHLVPLNQLAGGDRFHHYSLTSPLDRNLIVELHYHLLGTEGHGLLTDQQMKLLLSEPITVEAPGGVTFLTLNSEAHLLYLSAHIALQHGLYEKKLLRFTDIHFLIEKNPIDWEAVISRAVGLKWSYAVERVLMHTASLFSTTLPGDLLERLRDQRHPDENCWLVDRLQQEGARRRAIWAVIRAYPSLPQRVRVLFTLLFPSTAFMKMRYHIPPGTPVWPYYIKRLFGRIPSPAKRAVISQ